MTERDVMVILHALFYFGIYLSITAFFEFMNLRQFVFPQYINDPLVSDLHLNRARGPFLNAAVNGVAILIGFISGLHLLEKKSGFAKFFYQVSVFIFLPAVFFTLTRSVYLGLIIVLIIFLAFYKTTFSKWKLLALPLALILILAVANSPRLLSSERREGGVAQVGEVTIRMALLQQDAILFLERPLTGIGLAQFIPTTVQAFRGPVPFILEYARGTFQHNHLMGIATELGLIGLAIYVTMLVFILRRFKQSAGKLAEKGIMGDNIRIAILAVWCVYLNNNLFIDPSVSLFVNAVPFIFAGLLDGLYTRSLEAPLPAPLPAKMSVSPIRIINSHV
jgi:O-antigen ligase